MKYIMFFTTDDYETNRVRVEREIFENFEDVMRGFTLLCSTRDNVLVIEAETKKVVCHYISGGKVIFNKLLLDGTTVYVDDVES